MTQFTRGQSVTFTRDGETLTGTVEDLGSSLIGVRMPDTFGQGTHRNRYYAVNHDQVVRPEARKTPAEKAGLKEGDTVRLLKPDLVQYFGSEFTELKRDDGSSMPRFGDARHGLWIELSDVQKVEAGPKAGVSWKDAPIGATHYSLKAEHDSKWHKLDTDGNWHYAMDDSARNTTFRKYGQQHYAFPEQLVAIPGVTVEVVVPVVDPVPALKEELAVIKADIVSREVRINELTRQLDVRRTEAQAKEAEIRRADAKADAATWNDGDIVVCTTREGKGMANIIVGGKYRVKKAQGIVYVVDGDGDEMRACVSAGCFQLHSRKSVNLADVPSTEWKAGDVVEAQEDSYDIKRGNRYVLTGIDADGWVLFRDNAGAARMRHPRHYKLMSQA